MNSREGWNCWVLTCIAIGQSVEVGRYISPPEETDHLGFYISIGSLGGDMQQERVWKRLNTKRPFRHFLYTMCEIMTLSAITVFMTLTLTKTHNCRIKRTTFIKSKWDWITLYDLQETASIFKHQSKKLWVLLFNNYISTHFPALKMNHSIWKSYSLMQHGVG